jgi:4-amino-4-deoxy-L-arabinose transferase-like glycosyltransferase
MHWLNHTSSKLTLILILVFYLLVGGLYAVYTPAWQAPDEPAHYNYVRYLAEKGRFPVLHLGDYPHAYLERIKAARFPPDMSIEPIRYEFWQPPLYYIVATPVYRLFDGALLPLRLLSVMFGAGVVLLAYAIALTLRPGDTALALGAAAFVAFVPMHLTMMASVNNDGLAELLLAAVILLLIRFALKPSDQGQASRRKAYLVVIGVLLGLGLVTKATVYVAVPLALVALLLSERRPACLAQRGLAFFVPALVLASPWYVRNIAVYGWPDLLGTIHHDAVVVGQLRTADYLSSVGWATYLKDFAVTTFHSFWGQFGWMAVPMDRRIYLALGLLSALMLAGFVLYVWHGKDMEDGRVGGWKIGRVEGIFSKCRGVPLRSPCGAGARHCPYPELLRRYGGRAVHIIALWPLLTGLVYLYYNLSLVQFQGRYLFPMLIPVGLMAVLGLREILSRRRVWIAAVLCGGVALIIVIASLIGGDLDKWGLLIAGGATLVLIARRWLPAIHDGWISAVPLVGLAGLSVYSLFAFIVPYLSP